MEYAYIGAAECLRDMGMSDLAHSEYEAATEWFPTNPLVWTGLASALMDLGRFDEAVTTFGKADTFQGSPIARIGRASAFAKAGKFEAAAGIIDEVLEDFPSNVPAQCLKATLLRAEGKIDEAMSVYDACIIRSPYAAAPIHGKGRLLVENERFKDAAALYRNAYKLLAHNRELATGYVVLLRRQGKSMEALGQIENLTKQFPFDANLDVLRAEILADLGEADAAEKAYNRVLADKPYAKRALLGKAALLAKIGRLDEAERLLPDFRPRTLADWRQLVLRALLLEQKGSLRDSAYVLQKALSECPFAQGRRAIRSALATLELRRGRTQEARRLVETAPDQVTNVVALHVFAATHRPGRARARFETILSSDGPAVVIELATEIARRHELVKYAPRHSSEWLVREERALLLREVA